MEFDRIPIRGFDFQDHEVTSGDVSAAQDDALCCPAIKSVCYPCISQQFFGGTRHPLGFVAQLGHLIRMEEQGKPGLRKKSRQCMGETEKHRFAQTNLSAVPDTVQMSFSTLAARPGPPPQQRSAEVLLGRWAAVIFAPVEH